MKLHLATSTLLAAAVLFSACGSAGNSTGADVEVPKGPSLTFDTVGQWLTRGELSENALGATTTETDQEFELLWEPVRAESALPPLNGRIGVLINANARYRDPVVESVTGEGSWIILISAEATSSCNRASVVAAPIIALAVAAEEAPESVEVILREREGCSQE